MSKLKNTISVCKLMFKKPYKQATSSYCWFGVFLGTQGSRIRAPSERQNVKYSVFNTCNSNLKHQSLFFLQD